MVNPTKYPRTLHLPWSPGRSRDDLVIEGIEHFEQMERIVVTEKLDGENTTLYNNNFHARSLDSRTHPSRNWLKAFHASLSYRIPENIRICGENVFAKHSIGYTKLTTYFYAFAVYRNSLCLDWRETKELCAEWGIELVPVIYEGPWDETLIKDCWKNRSAFGTSQEGYVVRNAGSFSYPEFGKNVAKYVRPGHVNSAIHWMNAPVKPNRLDTVDSKGAHNAVRRLKAKTSWVSGDSNSTWIHVGTSMHFKLDLVDSLLTEFFGGASELMLSVDRNTGYSVLVSDAAKRVQDEVCKSEVVLLDMNLSRLMVFVPAGVMRYGTVS